MNKTATACIVFNEALMEELLPLASERDDDTGAHLRGWANWVGFSVSAIHAIKCKVEAGQPILIPCELCGDMLSMFEVARDETICAECKEDEDEPPALPAGTVLSA